MIGRRALLLNAWAQVGLWALIVVLVNLWSERHFLRLDLSEDHAWSLSEATRGLLARLEKPLVARVYFSEDLEAPYNNHRQRVIDVLEEMRGYSGGWLDVVVQDPSGRPELEEEASRYGIAPEQVQFRSADREEIRSAWMGLALIYGERQASVPSVAAVGTLEYELATALKGLLAEEERRVVGYSSGHGEPDLASATGPLQTLTTRIRQRHDLARVPLGGTGMVPEKVDALLVIGPQAPLGDRALYQIDQVLMRGGSVAFFLSNMRPDLRSLRPQNLQHGAEALLEHYGVVLNRDIVIDRKRNIPYTFDLPVAQYRVRSKLNYALIPRAPELSRTSLITRGADALTFPFASTLSLAATLPPEVTAEVLAATAADAGRVKQLRTVDPRVFQNPLSSEEIGSFPLMVALAGTWTSAFSGREIPAPDPGQGDAGGPGGAPVWEGAPARLAVAGSSDFVANNLTVMLNLVDWMVQDEALIGIRSRAVAPRELRVVSYREGLWFKAVNLLGGGLALIAFGAVRRALRRRGVPGEAA